MINTIFVNDDIITRRVLFEKNGMSHRLLYDFSAVNWILRYEGLSSIEKIKQKSNDNMLFGEFFSGDNDIINDVVSLYNISHCIKNLELIKNKLYGDVIFLDTHTGKIASNLFNLKLLKFCVRATGSYELDNIMVDDVITIDARIKDKINT